MEERNVVVTGGVSLTKLLAVAFIVLKLLNVINWSWVWVLAPIWMPIALWIAIVIILFIGATIVDLIENRY